MTVSFSRIVGLSRGDWDERFANLKLLRSYVNMFDICLISI